MNTDTEINYLILKNTVRKTPTHTHTPITNFTFHCKYKIIRQLRLRSLIFKWKYFDKKKRIK